MFESCLRLHFLCCVSPSSFYTFKYDNSSYVACHPNQTQALTEFMNEFDSSQCNLSEPYNGVWCDKSTGAVAMLRLRACLIGTLKPNSSLFRLHHLRYLALRQNNFISSSLPYELGSFNSTSLFELHHLRYLHLGYNNFSSSLPSEFGNLNRLNLLALSSNDFFGKVPPTISNLTSLKELYLHHNQLTGSFPLVQNLTMLSVIDINHNLFSGTIPSSLFTMPSLSRLDMRVNNLTAGSIEVYNSSTPSRLEYMYLGHNNFEGKVIGPISTFINLKVLELSYLNTSYPVDLSLFSSLKSLLRLDLSGNIIYPASLDTNSKIPTNLEMLLLQDCGINEFPNILKNLEKLEFIALNSNRIKGEIPEWLWNLPRLTSVIVTNNSITGFGKFIGEDFSYGEKISHAIDARLQQPLGSNSSMLEYNLRENSLEGSIPDAFYTGASLQTLDVGHNRLTGKLPRSLHNCSSLEFLVADHNRIKDKFPFWLKALPNLQVLILSSNKLYSSISPPDQGPLRFPELRIFEISDNKFTGSLPPMYFVNWKAASLTMNEDVGQIPESIGLLKALIALNFSNNAFTGHIPLSLSNLKKMESLDLSSNQLSGTIPSGLGTLSFLAYINMSHNQLKGEIPQGTQITGQAKSSFEGNAGLCGLPLQETCFFIKERA
ncbi:hypothetical protein F2Q68_00027852 [Brassica cretica]|uniref:Disease resistance R13L4/SHOC-2-like LRR domain-containing protein n=1 Tax=Brassica cretica TaxID=69181 RepID=A0A8S9IHG7_BRACR|nr:hypothetical protein F2Q68_00027852 [Brassica cretica]